MIVPLAPLSSGPAASRVVHNADAIEWLRAAGKISGASLITSLPDISELRLSFDAWQTWFMNAAASVLRSVDDDGVVVFFQSDIRRDGVWIDKGALVARAAGDEKMSLVFHKIVCRLPPGTPTSGRASYAHLIAFSRAPRALRRATPDVLPDGGFKPAMRAMGVNACLAACRLVLHETSTRTVIDPFCGFGTVLAVANAIGLDAVGVDLSAKMCRRARTLNLDLSAA